VLDVVLAEIDNPYQPDVANRLRSAGATIVRSDLAWVSASAVLRVPGLSAVDALGLYYARTFGRVLLAGDRKLRISAEALQVDVHGSLWLVEQLDAQRIVPASELLRWLDEWPRLGRRLPVHDLARLRSHLSGR
jgi:hypothetical protein